MKARELTLIPDDLFEVESMKEFLEWTTRVRDLLRYCRWYYCTAIDPGVTIEEFFNALVNNRKWKTLTHIWFRLSLPCPIGCLQDKARHIEISH